MATSCPMLLVLLFAHLAVPTSASRAKDGIGGVPVAVSSVTAVQSDPSGASKGEKETVVLLQAQRTLSRWNWPWASESEPEVANTMNQTDPAATLSMAVSKKTSDQDEGNAKGRTFSVPLDSQLLQLSNRTTAARPSVLAAQTANGGRTPQSGKSFSVKLDAQLLQHANNTWPKKLSSAIESAHGAHKKQKGATFSVKLDSQLLQIINASDPKALATLLAAQGTREGEEKKRGSTFSVKLDSQL